MNQLVQRNQLPVQKETSGVSVTPKQELVEAVSAILHSKFCNPIAPFSKYTIIGLQVAELRNLYAFLVNGIIESKNIPKRPKCPIVSLKWQSMARSDYKIAMINYISAFGYTFNSNPCFYTPAFLEALANYCEYGVEMKKGDMPNITP